MAKESLILKTDEQVRLEKALLEISQVSNEQTEDEILHILQKQDK